MMDTRNVKRPSWFYVALIFLLVGGVIFLTGIYYLLFPGRSVAVLAGIHPNIWWGGMILLVGGLFLLLYRNISHE